jgi:hypothetical protein|uniref:Uncharacterized protein n=1 Tax=Mus musculus TaxID=10090 RepID=Q8BW48_MOUSE|nr:unnamed protein product [Mus musculus]
MEDSTSSRLLARELLILIGIYIVSLILKSRLLSLRIYISLNYNTVHCRAPSSPSHPAPHFQELLKVKIYYIHSVSFSSQAISALGSSEGHVPRLYSLRTCSLNT